jgi:hypothetical protein
LRSNSASGRLNLRRSRTPVVAGSTPSVVGLFPCLASPGRHRSSRAPPSRAPAPASRSLWRADGTDTAILPGRPAPSPLRCPIRHHRANIPAAGRQGGIARGGSGPRAMARRRPVLKVD